LANKPQAFLIKKQIRTRSSVIKNIHKLWVIWEWWWRTFHFAHRVKITHTHAGVKMDRKEGKLGSMNGWTIKKVKV
jgi:hypothetical protein